MLVADGRIEDGRYQFCCPSCGVDHFLKSQPSVIPTMSCYACSAKFEVRPSRGSSADQREGERSSVSSNVKARHDWLVRIDEKTYPARDSSMLREWLKSGRIGRYTFVFDPETRMWMCLRDVPELTE